MLLKFFLLCAMTLQALSMPFTIRTAVASEHDDSSEGQNTMKADAANIAFYVFEFLFIAALMCFAIKCAYMWYTTRNLDRPVQEMQGRLFLASPAPSAESEFDVDSQVTVPLALRIATIGHDRSSFY
jgi:hypothetical protein